MSEVKLWKEANQIIKERKKAMRILEERKKKKQQEAQKALETSRREVLLKALKLLRFAEIEKVNIIRSNYDGTFKFSPIHTFDGDIDELPWVPELKELENEIEQLHLNSFYELIGENSNSIDKLGFTFFIRWTISSEVLTISLNM